MRPMSLILSKLEKVKRSGKGYTARCPGHDDNHASLSIREVEDGKVLLKCHATCTLEAILKALGLEKRDLFVNQPNQPKTSNSSKYVAIYDYHDEQGKLIFQVCRTKDKQFPQRRPDRKGGWVWGLAGVVKVLYRLPKIIQAITAKQIIFLCEGEKDVNNLVKLGFNATCNPGGAMKWENSFNKALQGANIVILPDNDQPGRNHANLVASSLYGNASEIRIVELPGLPEKGDVSDWLANGGTREQLERLAEQAPLWQSSNQNKRTEVEQEEKHFLNPISVDEVESFPIESFPYPLNNLISEGAKAINCPPDFIGVPVLALIGTAIGISRALQIKQGWIEGSRIYGAVVADPGSKKSPALDLALHAFKKHQFELQEEYRKSKGSYKTEFAQFEIAFNSWKQSMMKKSAKPDEKPEQPQEPAMKQIFTTDATLEALAGLLEQNPRGILFYRDELTGWALAMNQYKGGKGSDRQSWLSFWNGSQVIVNRKNRKEPIVLNCPFINVIGSLPPDVLSDLSDERGREDGFIHRILFAFPKRIPGIWTEDEVSPDIVNGIEKLFKDLWRLSPSIDEQGNPRPVIIPFAPNGKAVFMEWIKSHYQEQEDSLFSENLRGPWAKFEGYCARLALIIHECRYVMKEVNNEAVDAKSVNGAIALINYFKSHTKRVYARLSCNKEDKQILSILEWIRKQGGEVKAREILRYRVAGVRTSSDVEYFLRQLEERGYGVVKEEISYRGGRKSLKFCISLIN